MKHKMQINIRYINQFVEKHMRSLKAISLCILAASMLTMTACSGSDAFPFFQNNAGNTDPMGGGSGNPFSGLPNNIDPSLLESPVALIAEAFNPGTFNLNINATDYQYFADRMEKLRVDHQTEVDEVLYKVSNISNDATYADPQNHGIYALIKALHSIMGYMINQSNYNSANDPYTGYTGDTYSFFQDIKDANTGIKNDAYNLMFKNLRYILSTYSPAEINDMMTDMSLFLSDNTGQTLPLLVLNLQEGLGKILMRADTNISYDDPLDYDGGGLHDIKLGNAVSGIDSLLLGANDIIINDSNAKQNLYDIIRESGKLLGLKSGGNFVFKNKIKQLMIDLRDYFTVGGAQYATSNYNNASNPYVNAELRNGIKDLWPGLVKLFIRQRNGGAADPDYSIYKSSMGSATRSPLEWLTIALGQLKNNGIDFSAAGNEVEPSLRRMFQYNGQGENRASAGYKVPYLTHLISTIATSYNYGYLTRVVGDASLEPFDNHPSPGGGNCSGIACNSYQHGASTKGILTMNDSMFAMTNNGQHVTCDKGWPIGVVLDQWTDTYNLALARRTNVGVRTWRSNSYFANNAANRSDYEFYIGYDYPTQLLLPPGAAGDAGIPNGGQKSMTPNQDATVAGDANNDYRTYFPKVADGIGELNTAAWIFGWIARVCWDGAGPYYTTAGSSTTSFNWPTKGIRSVSVYYKPNGEVYAYVYKGADPWEYYYPHSGITGIGNDVADPDPSANGQRYNRYRDVLKSDYYLVQKGQEHGGTSLCGQTVSDPNPLAYCTPPMNPSGSTYADLGRGKYYLAANSSFNSSYFQAYEKVQEWTNANVNDPTDAGYYVIGNQSRECASQEEAMFRNYQWLMLEKKLMFIIPMDLYTTWNVSVAGLSATAYLDSAAFVIIEANGIVGISNAKKGPSNGVWNSKNSEGVGANPAGHRNNPDYGDSLRPGDSRIVAFASYFAAAASGTSNGELTPDVVYSLLGSGSVLPAIIGKNIGPVGRMGFIDQTAYIPSTFSSSPGPLWDNRNRTLPLFIAIAGVMKDGTYYESGGGFNYNYAGRHKYPLRELLEGVMIPLSKPLMRYWTDGESFSGGGATSGRWVPRMNTEPTINGQTRFDHFQPTNQGTVPDYLPKSDIRTLTGLLAEHDPTAASLDGLLCMLAEGPPSYTINTRVVTKLLALLQRLGAEDANYGDSGKAIRRNFFKGLEQIITGMQISQGEVINTTAGNGRTWLDNRRYTWLKTPVRTDPVGVDMDNALNQLIGYHLGNHATDMGLAEFVYDRQASDWTQYDRLFDTMGAMMGDTSNPSFYITEDVISILDKLLNSVTATPADLKALRHTLGVLMARRDSGTWKPTTGTPASSELYQILSVYLPDILKAYNQAPTNEFHYLLAVLVEFMNVHPDPDPDPGNAVMEPDNLNFMTDLLIKGDTAQQIIENTYELLGRDAMWDPAYYGGGYPNHAVMKELANILETLANKP